MEKDLEKRIRVKEIEKGKKLKRERKRKEDLERKVRKIKIKREKELKELGSKVRYLWEKS